MYKFFRNLFKKKHNSDLYNNILYLSRNIFFYEKLGLPDTFQSRIHLMFFHFALLLIIAKKRGTIFDQNQYDFFLNNIEHNLRELGYGDVSVNSKMKDLNKILYDILLKIEDRKNSKSRNFIVNERIVIKYFDTIKLDNEQKINQFQLYFVKFFDFCFELSDENMLKHLKKFNY